MDTLADSVDFASLRAEHVKLFGGVLRLEMRFSKEPALEFESSSFCEHFPASFVKGDADIQRLSAQVKHTTKRVRGMSERLLAGADKAGSTKAATEGGAPAPAPAEPRPVLERPSSVRPKATSAATGGERRAKASEATRMG
jgi:hypothetical protein